MPSYSSYMRQMSVLDKDDDITWITVKGNHIPIKKGQSKEDAVKEFLESKKSGSSKSDKGATSKSAPAKSESKSAGTKTKKEYPHEFETGRKNALANPLTYNHRYTQKSKAAAYKEYQETAGKKSDNGGSKGNFNLKKTYGDLWDKHKIESGSALYEDDTKAMKVFNDLESELKKHGINELSDDVYNDLEDNNYHSLNMMLSLSGKFGKEKQKNALEMIERLESKGYKGSSFSTSVAKKMSQGDLPKVDSEIKEAFEDFPKFKIKKDYAVAENDNKRVVVEKYSDGVIGVTTETEGGELLNSAEFKSWESAATYANKQRILHKISLGEDK